MADTIGGTPSQSQGEPQYDWQKPKGTQFEIGDVISRAFDMLRRNFVPFAITALIVLGIPAVLTFLFALGAFGGSGNAALGAASGIGMALSVLTLIVSSIVLPAAIIFASLKGWAGEPISMRESMRLMLSRFFSLLGLGIVVGFGIGFATLLLIIPGIIVYCGWFVVVPVLIMERKGVFDSLSRGWQLTSGYKWQVFAIAVVAFIISLLISTLFTAPTLMASMDFDVLSGETAGPGTMALGFYQLLSTVGDAIAQLLSALFVASTYYELRRVKEGVGIGAIASVFD